MPLHRAEERALIARLVLGLIRVIHRSRFGKANSMVCQVETLLVSGAVLLGEIDGHPRTSSEIARIVGIPRPTAVRKLNELIRREVVQRRGKRYFMNEKDIAQKDAYIDEAIGLIVNTRSTLSRKITDKV